MGINEFIQIGSRIKEVRKQKGIKQKELAKQLSLPISTYANYENNHREPPSETIEAIANILGISKWDLMFDSHNLSNELAFISYLESIGYVVQSDMNPLEWENDPNGNKFPISFDESPDAPNCILIKDGIEIKLTNGQMNDLQRELRNYTGYQINQYKK